VPSILCTLYNPSTAFLLLLTVFSGQTFSFSSPCAFSPSPSFPFLWTFLYAGVLLQYSARGIYSCMLIPDGLDDGRQRRRAYPMPSFSDVRSSVVAILLSLFFRVKGEGRAFFCSGLCYDMRTVVSGRALFPSILPVATMLFLVYVVYRLFTVRYFYAPLTSGSDVQVSRTPHYSSVCRFMPLYVFYCQSALTVVHAFLLSGYGTTVEAVSGLFFFNSSFAGLDAWRSVPSSGAVRCHGMAFYSTCHIFCCSFCLERTGGLVLLAGIPACLILVANGLAFSVGRTTHLGDSAALDACGYLANGVGCMRCSPFLSYDGFAACYLITMRTTLHCSSPPCAFRIVLTLLRW